MKRLVYASRYVGRSSVENLRAGSRLGSTEISSERWPALRLAIRKQRSTQREHEDDATVRRGATGFDECLKSSTDFVPYAFHNHKEG
jgi:hypothetical protein